MAARSGRHSSKLNKPEVQAAVLGLRDVLRREVSDRGLKRLDARAGLVMSVASVAVAFISVIASLYLIPFDLLSLTVSVLFVVLLATNIPYRLAEIADSVELRIRSLQFLYYIVAGVAFYGVFLLVIFLLKLAWLLLPLAFSLLAPLLLASACAVLLILVVAFFLIASPKQVGYRVWEELAPEHPHHTLAANYLSTEAFPAGLSVALLLWSIPMTLFLGPEGLTTIGTSVGFALVYLWTRRSREENAQRHLESPDFVS